MKTEAQVKEELKKEQKHLKSTQKNFEKYDNHDDMDEIERSKSRVQVLEWVLSE
jgi:hypothetical protein